MRGRRGLLVVLGALVLAAVACAIRGSAAPRFAPDLIGNLTGGHLLAVDRASLYSPEAQHAWQIVQTGRPTFFDLYISPPHAALLFVPFAALPMPWALGAFTVASISAFVLAVILARPLFPEAHGFELAVLAFAAAEPLAETIIMGQTSALSLLLWVGGVRLALVRRDFASGFVFGLGLLKPQLFIVVPVVLVLMKRWRSLAGFIVAASLLLLVGAIAAGPHAYVAWVELLRSPSYLTVRAANQFHMCSVEALLVGVATPQVAVAINIAVGGAVLVSLVIALLRRRVAGEPRIWAATVLATLILAPHVIVYDLVILFVPALLLARDLPKRWPQLALASAFAIAWALPLHGPPLVALPLIVLFVTACREGPKTSGSTGR